MTGKRTAKRRSGVVERRCEGMMRRQNRVGSLIV
jgi:hypothetical protein